MTDISELLSSFLKRPELQDRFWSKVEKSEGCWNWIAGKHHRRKHGVFSFGNKSLIAPRVSFFLNNGFLDSELLICHHCDNPSCVKPEHLFQGTQKHNIQDAIRKGRMATGQRNGARLHPEKWIRGDRHHAHIHPEKFRGELNPRSKVSESQVLEMRALYDSGMRMTTIASLFGLGKTCARYAIKGVTWGHLK